MSLREKIGTTANVATILLAVLLGTLLVKGDLTLGRARVSAPSRSSQIGTDMKHVPLAVNWSANDRTLLMSLQTTCHFCSESAPFFRRLTAAAAGKTRTVAVLPQPPDVAKRYLDGLGVRVDEIKQASLPGIGVDRTPTLMLVDRSGVVRGAWTGELASEDEADVLSAVEGKAASTHATVQDRPPGTKAVQLEPQVAGDPVSIVQVLEGDTDVTPTTGQNPVTGKFYKRRDGKPFEAGDDWLKNLVVVIKNLSNKEIVAGSIRLDFPETGAGIEGDSFMSKSVELGRKPDHALYRPDGVKLDPATAEPLQLLPGQELRVPLAPYYAEIRTIVEKKRPITSITTLRLIVQFFYFADGTRWAPNNFQKPDPGTPGKYILITPDEFRGRPNVNVN
jgi:hypothetical protein